MIVAKFGGSSVASAEQFKKVKKIIEQKIETIQENLPVVVKQNLFTKVWNFIKRLIKR